MIANATGCEAVYSASGTLAPAGAFCAFIRPTGSNDR